MAEEPIRKIKKRCFGTAFSILKATSKNYFLMI